MVDGVRQWQTGRQWVVVDCGASGEMSFTTLTSGPPIGRLCSKRSWGHEWAEPCKKGSFVLGWSKRSLINMRWWLVELKLY